MLPTRRSSLSHLVSPALASGSIAILLGIGSLAGLAGCAKEEPTAAVDALGNPIAVAGLDVDASQLGYRQSWIGVAPMTGGVRLLTSVGEDVLVVDGRGTASLLNGQTGALRWSVSLPDAIAVPRDARRAGDNVIINCGSELVYFRQESGDLVARKPLSPAVSTAGGSVGSMVLFGSPGGELVSFDTDLGVQAWRYGLSSPVIVGPVPIIGRAVGVVTAGGQVVVLDARSGNAEGVVRLAGGARVRPVARDGLLFVASEDQSLYAITSSSPVSIAWRIRTEVPLTKRLLAGPGRVYLPIPGSGVSAFDSKSGKPAWNNPKLVGEPIALRGANLILQDGGTLISADAASGDEVGRLKLPNFGIASVMGAADAVEGPLLIALTDGRVLRLNQR